MSIRPAAAEVFVISRKFSPCSLTSSSSRHNSTSVMYLFVVAVLLNVAFLGSSEASGAYSASSPRVSAALVLIADHHLYRERCPLVFSAIV